MSRALLNNEAVVKFIKENFIPVSGAVEHLQPSRYGSKESAESKWFEPLAKRALKEYAPGFFKQFGSYQGMYVAGPDGTPYQFKIGLAYDSQDFIEGLKSALRKSRIAQSGRANSRQPVSAPLQKTRSGARDSTSVIQVYSRVCPLPANATLSERSIGRDVMWIFPEEIDEIFTTAKQSGVAVAMPSTLVARMVRFQLLNHVGNIMRPFAENDVKQASFKITPLQANGNIQSFEFQGSYASKSPGSKDSGGPYSVDGKIDGQLSIDRNLKKVIRFRAFGEATSLGGNDSLTKTRRYPVVFALTESTDPVAREVVPFWAAIPLWAPIYERPKILL